MAGKIIVFAAPSGSGKSTIIESLMPREDLHLSFSISATTRAPRGKEKNGVEYFFMSLEEFRQHIEADDFVEYEEVYKDCYYGTLKRQVAHQLEAGQNLVLDLDVHGAMRVKELYGDRAMSLFVKPPSLEVLQDRLENRKTDTPEVIKQRLARAAYELTYADKFDCIVVNDILETARNEAYEKVRNFLNQ